MYEVVAIVFEGEVESYRESYSVYASMERALIGQISACVEYSEMDVSAEIIIEEIVE